jgi:hypothetical protein
VRLEYLRDGSPDCPLLRLFNFGSNEAGKLLAAVADLAVGRAAHVAVHELADVTPVGGCELVLQVTARDAAVVQVGPVSFACRFTARTWDNVAGLVEPFAEGASGFQWLAASPGETKLLLSPSGEW